MMDYETTMRMLRVLAWVFFIPGTGDVDHTKLSQAVLEYDLGGV